MRNHLLFIYLFIYFLTGCKGNLQDNKNTIIPSELNKKWLSILKTDGEFHQKCSSGGVDFLDGDTLSFGLMDDEYAKIKEVIPTEYGYRILFKEFRFDAEYRLYWIDKKRGIGRWEYFNNEEDPVFENFSFYATDSLNYNMLPSLSCEKCRNKEECEKLSEEEIKKFDAYWKINCDEKKRYLIGLSPISEFYMDFTFKDNDYAKIIATVVKDLEEENSYLLKYDMLTGITRANRSLDWFNFSKDSIIAKIKLLPNNKELEFSWNGFYNMKTKRWESKDFVFSESYKSPIILENCGE